jgi:hypothetical protein
MAEQMNTTLDSLRDFGGQIINLLPQLLIAAVLLIVGWLIAKLLRRMIVKLLRLLRVDVAAEKAGVEDFLLQGGVQYTTVTIIANFVYWAVIFTVILAALNSLGLAGAQELFNKIILYIPNVIIATLVLIFGTLFAKLVQRVTFTYLSNVGIAGAEFVSHVAQWALIVFVVSVALEQLAIGGQVLVSAFQIAFGALCLALALAFGLGGRDWATHILEKLWKNKRSS